jgi:CelD/BcsL family acetyltransferase involved in cellulose biosynthesis
MSDARGHLAAAGVFERVAGGLRSASDVHSGDWDIVAADAHQRRRFWTALSDLGLRRLSLEGLRLGAEDGAAAQEVLSTAGYGVLVSEPQGGAPYLELPSSFEELLDARSRNLRSQWGRKRRRLERMGAVGLRQVTGGPTLDRDLQAFFRLEAAGWKGRNGTAILRERGAEALYRDFSRQAAEHGWLRLLLLELDGEILAADLSCALGGVGFLIKTAYDERRADLSPGLVLRGEALRLAIGEGLHGYDFLGGADRYKLQWTDDIRPRQSLRAYRGPAGRAFEQLTVTVGRPARRAARGFVHDHPPLHAALERTRRLSSAWRRSR